MMKFDLNDYMLDGMIEDALRGDLNARDFLLSECRIYQKKRRKPPEKIINCLRELKKRKKGRSRRDTFLDYLTFSYIRYLQEEGYSWDRIAEKCVERFKISTSRKTLERVYYSYLPLQEEYERLLNPYLIQNKRKWGCKI